MGRILVVDDEISNLSAMKRIFARHDYVLEVAENGEEALANVPKFNPDLLILDIMMAGLDGYEVCRRLKSDSATAHIMILLVSGKGSLDDRLKGYGFGADDFIIKPYDPEELRAKVKILLRLKQAQDDLVVLNRSLEKLVENRTKELVKKERQAVVGQMVQGIVHNLRGPLMVVHGRTDIMSRIVRNLPEGAHTNFKGIEDIKRNLSALLEGVNRAELLVDVLLAKGRKEATIEENSLNLNEIIKHELHFLEADMFIRHEIKKRFQFDSTIPEILGIYSDFSQVVYNLTRNAADAMKESPLKELTIETSHDDENIYLTFEDTGPGIPAENLERIFDPFFSTKANKGESSEEELEGTGLGLYTSSQLIKAYGGEIRVESTPGGGAIFTVVIAKNQQSLGADSSNTC